MNLQSDIEHIKQTIHFLYKPGDTYEVCGIGDNRYLKTILSGYFTFNDADKVISQVQTRSDVRNWYCTLNPCDSALLARAKRKLVNLIKAERTKDVEILLLRHLLIDVDPQRPSGISSSDGEKKEAFELVPKVKEYLTGLQWGDPLFADSGNGYHLVFSLPDLENTPENVDLLKRVLQGLAEKFDTKIVKIDQRVFNPARITKLYGTVARKGDSISERPHRVSRILHLPEQRIGPTIGQLEAIAAVKEEKKTAANKTSSNSTFDLEAYLRHYNIEVKKTKPHGSSTLYILNSCMFDDTHKGGESSIGQGDDGKLFYQCFHDSCKGQKWEDARRVISGTDSLARFMSNYQGDSQNKVNERVNIGHDELKRRARLVLKQATIPCESFDTSCLPEILKNYIDSICLRTEAEPIMVTSSVLSCASAFVKLKVFIPESDDGYFQQLYANIWTLSIIASGQFKTTSLNKGFAIAFEREKELDNVVEKQPEEIIASSVILPTRITPEALFQHLALGYSGAIVQSEFGGWLASLEKKYNVDLKATLTDFYDVPEVFTYKTKTGGLLKVKKPFVTICGVSTVEWINEHFKPDDLSSGFFARFLLFYPPVKDKIPPALPEPKADINHEALNKFKEILYNLPEQRAYKLDGIKKEFQMIHEAMYNQFKELPQELQGKLSPFLKRWSPYLLKLSMLLQLFIDGSNELYIDALMGATQILNQAVKSTIWLFQNEMGESEHLKKRRKILEYIAKKDGELSWRQLIQSRVLDGGTSEYEYIVKTLDDAGLIEVTGSFEKKKNMTMLLSKQAC